MNFLLRLILVSFVFATSISIIELSKPAIVQAQSLNDLKTKTSQILVPYEHLVEIKLLSPQARLAAQNVKQWSNSTNLVWIAVYREGKENYIFYTRGKDQFFVFRTNPEKGGDYTIPKGKIFAVNDTMLDKIISKQTPKGTYRFKGTTNGSYNEKYVTPLVQVDKDGYELPNQNAEPYWAMHSPPYKGNIPDEELNTPGNSCIRLKINVARFIQKTVSQELLANRNYDFNVYLMRYDPKEFE